MRFIKGFLNYFFLIRTVGACKPYCWVLLSNQPQFSNTLVIKLGVFLGKSHFDQVSPFRVVIENQITEVFIKQQQILKLGISIQVTGHNLRSGG